MTREVSVRLDRVESTLAIQQLPCRYAVAVDSRDIDGWLELWAEDVDCGRQGKGREALRKFIDPALRTFYRSVHLICGHVIDFVDADNATGKVYCRAEHEAEGKWIAMAICYFDTYRRDQGQWFFTRRDEQHWYSVDVLERPEGPNFQRWETWKDRHPKLPAKFASWAPFWSRSSDDDIAAITKKQVS